MLSVAEAEKQVLGAVSLLPAEDCPLASAHGRVLRQTIAADRDLPPFDRVAMDGYAIRHEAWQGGIRRFRVAGLQAAGTRPLTLAAEDTCIEVMTGAALPIGSDTIVPYEDTAADGSAMVVGSATSVAAGQAVHRCGSDHAAGSVIVNPGIRLGGREIAVAAACGCAHLAVSQQPVIAVVATGDELVEVSSPVAPHQIRRSNDYALRAALVGAGYPRAERFHLRDMRQEIEHVLWHIVAEYDAVLITGGAAKGKFDFLPAVLDDLGVRKIFQGVAQRPGKPFWFGRSPRQTPVFALPGNPASAYLCLQRYVLPALARMSGLTPGQPGLAVLIERVVFQPALTLFLPVTVSAGPRGERQAAPAPLNTSGDLAGLAGTDGFVELPAEVEVFEAGAVVPFWPWS